MKQIRIIFLLYLLIIVVMTAFYLMGSQLNIEHIPITGTNLLLMAFLLFWFAYKLRDSFKDSGIEEIKMFGIYFFFYSLFFFFMSAPHLVLIFSHSSHELFSFFMNWGYIIGHAFLYIAFAFLVRVPLGFSLPKLKNLGSAFFVLTGGIITVLNIILPNNAYFDHTNGITLLNPDPLVGKLVGINALIIFLPIAIYFLRRAIKTEGFTRNRSLFIFVGFILSIVGGPLHDLSVQPLVILIADFLILGSNVVLASSMFYKRENIAKS